MILATHLRCGNLVEINVSQGKYENITHEVSEGDLANTNGLYAIPLTEEWLNKLGFNKINIDDFILHKIEEYYIYYIAGNNVGRWRKDTPTEKPQYLAECNHVHQLQNLYFALTGEELEVK